MNKIVSVRSHTNPAASTSSQVPLRNEDLRTILSDLKAGNPMKKGLLERFLSESPLKEHSLSLEKTTDQGGLLVALTHLLRGSLVDKHSTFKNLPDPLNPYRQKAELGLGSPENLTKFKAALKLKLEAFHTKNLKTIGGIVLAAGPVDLVSPFHWVGLVKDVITGIRRDALDKPIFTGSVYNEGFRAHFIGKKVEQAILDILKTEEQLPWAKILINEDATHAQKAKAAIELFNLSQITRTFGNDPAVLTELVKRLPVFTNPNAKMALSAAICEGRFSVDAGVLKKLYRLNMVPFKDLMDSGSPRVQTALYREFKFGLTPPSGISETDTPLHSFFGAKRYTSSEVKAALKDKFKDMSEDALEAMCDDGAAYACQIYGDYAVLCKIGAGSVSEASFQGWLTSEYSALYADTLGKIAVYNCSVLTDGYPSKMEVSKTHADFNALPMYLMEAIRQNSFDASKFNHPQTIAFVASTILDPIVKKNRELGNKMKGIIQEAILNKGGEVSIASTREEDGAIKDAINTLCAATTHDFEASVMTHFNSLSTDRDKARLAYLLGQIAKAGVLGYHHGKKNQANDLFYSLSKKCFDELAYSREMVFPAGFHANLAKGVCIAAVTSNFRTLHPWVHDIFKKN